YSNIPFIQSSSFVGRTELLSKISHKFDTVLRGARDPVTLVLWGMGGRGKSRIALQYCHLRDNDGCRGIFWINALSEQTTIRSFQEIAEKL
ncbi:hypothetical protein B0T10DRAFT_376028, partial [Thelonectria olida]